MATECARCGTALPVFRRPSSVNEAMWGGWTCPRCGEQLDRFGRVRALDPRPRVQWYWTPNQALAWVLLVITVALVAFFVLAVTVVGGWRSWVGLVVFTAMIPLWVLSIYAHRRWPLATAPDLPDHHPEH